MSTREKIMAAFIECLKIRDLKLNVSDLSDDTVLLESGLDSLGFAILVVRLDDGLGYDPFTLMDTPVYPQTFGELVAIYDQFAPDRER